MQSKTMNFLGRTWRSKFHQQSLIGCFKMLAFFRQVSSKIERNVSKFFVGQTKHCAHEDLLPITAHTVRCINDGLGDQGTEAQSPTRKKRPLYILLMARNVYIVNYKTFFSSLYPDRRWSPHRQSQKGTKNSFSGGLKPIWRSAFTSF